MNIQIIQHPLIEHKLASLRNEKCHMPNFRKLLNEIGLLMVYEVTKELETVDLMIKTPVANAKGKKLKKDPVLVTILRAGIGMLEPFMQLLPSIGVTA